MNSASFSTFHLEPDMTWPSRRLLRRQKVRDFQKFQRFVILGYILALNMLFLRGENQASRDLLNELYHSIYNGYCYLLILKVTIVYV